MKKDIHPAYYADATIRCACGAIFKIGSTKKEIQTEICSQCHPFYTGKEKLIDTMGRVERFKSRKEKASKTIRKKTEKQKKKKRKTGGGGGGEDAPIFAADLARMYQRYAIKKNWKFTL